MSRFDVDFAHVREQADIVAVMAHYNVPLVGEGVQRKGPCPLHDDPNKSLSVNTGKRVFNCHACGNKGNVIKFVQLVDEGLQNPRRAALQIAKLSDIPAKPGGKVSAAVAAETSVAAKAAPVVAEEATEETPGVERTDDGFKSNRPLTFQLQLEALAAGGDSSVHRFVEAHGLEYDRLSELGIGLSSRGSMKDRLAIPIHNTSGELVAYCGRDVGLLDEADPEVYKFPAKFDRELELYGWHQAQDFDQIVVVKDVLAVVKHSAASAHHGEHGFGVVALMNEYISDAQIELLLQTGPRVIVCLAGDSEQALSGMSIAVHLANSGLWVTMRSCLGWKAPETVDSEAFCRAVSAE